MKAKVYIKHLYVAIIFMMVYGLSYGQKDILVVLAHPEFSRSQVNSHLVSKVEMLDRVTINNIYDKYPDFNIDVEREQELIVNHDIIVFQFPLYWFSSPALLKKWQDEVITSAFSIGKNNRLQGKRLMIVTSVGGSESEYMPGALMNATIDDILAPYQAFAALTKMQFLTPFITYSVPNPQILDIPMSADQKNDRQSFIESQGENLVQLFKRLP